MNLIRLKEIARDLVWYTIGLVVLTVGMSIITGHIAWIIVSGVAMYLMGAASTIGLAVYTTAKMEEG